MKTFTASNLLMNSLEAQKDDSVIIITENVDGELYMILASPDEIIDDWKEDCKTVPENDARVFFMARNGVALPISHTMIFEEVIRLLQG